MQISALAVIALFGVLGAALANYYGGGGIGGGYGYAMPAYYGGGGGVGDGGLLMLIGLLFILFLLFGSGTLFNNTASPTPISVIQG